MAVSSSSIYMPRCRRWRWRPLREKARPRWGVPFSKAIWVCVSGGRGNRAGLYRVLGLRCQRHGGVGRRLGSRAGVGLSGRGDLQYAGAGGLGEGCRPRGTGDVWDVKRC